MKITILGSGSFLTDINHLGPSFLLEENGVKILVDAGNGCQYQLAKLGIKVEDISYIFITHFHSDHTADLMPITFRYKMLLNMYRSDIKRNIKVYGPAGTVNFLDQLYSAHMHRKDWRGLETYDLVKESHFDGFSVRAFSVEHIGVPAIALRFNVKGKIVVFSGDTTMCEGVMSASENADIFFCDCSLSKNQTSEAHLNPIQIGEICKNNKVKKVVLVHILPPVYNEDLAGEVEQKFKGKVELGKDLAIHNI